MEEQYEELKRLRRQYRILVNDKHALKGAYALKEPIQKKAVTLLRQELADLKALRKLTKRTAEDHKINHNLQSLVKTNHGLVLDLQTQKECIHEIDSQIKDMQSKIHKLEKRQVPTESEKRRLHYMQRCENKLDTCTKQYGVILTENRKLRQEVMAQLKDRKLFNDQFNIMMKQLQKGKYILMEIMDHTKIVYDQREECLGKLQALQIKSKMVFSHHVEEMTEMKRYLNAQTELGRFIRTKGCRRIMADLERKELDKRESQWQIIQNEVDKYRDMVDHIRNFVGEKKISRIATIFIRKENENFGLFNYVNILNSEIEALSKDIYELQTRIDLQDAKRKKKDDVQKQSIKELEKIYKITKQNANDAAAKLKAYDKELARLMVALEDTFGGLDSKAAPILALLGGSMEITPRNVLTHLEIFDGKLAEMITQRTGPIQNKARNTQTRSSTTSAIQATPKDVQYHFERIKLYDAAPFVNYLSKQHSDSVSLDGSKEDNEADEEDVHEENVLNVAH